MDRLPPNTSRATLLGNRIGCGRLRLFQPLRSVPVALLWGGLSLSALGDQLYAVALTWIAVGVLGSAAGYLSALQALVLLVTVLGIGRWADQWHPQRSMIAADLARAAILLAVVAAWMATATPNAAQLIAAVVVLAIGQAVFQPALQATLPLLVDDAARLPAANGLLDATDRSARLLGPGLVALLAGVVPAMHFLTLDAFSFLASAIAILLITRLRPDAAGHRHPARFETIRHSSVRGWRAMAAHPLLGYILATTGLLNGAWFAVYFLGLPLMIARHGVAESGLGAYGLVFTAYGSANLAGNMYFGGRTLTARPQFQIFGGTLLAGTGLALLGMASLLPDNWLVPSLAAAAALGSIGGPMKDIPVAVLRQTRLRPSDVAAGMRAYMASNSAGVLVAMLITPSVIARAGVVPLMIASGATYVCVGAVGLLRYAGWVEQSERRTD